ncbi:MAG: phosphoenolpyruvate--protein phosphotransferase [Oscillospiraceae bacterium]|jgi:phosphotransferase system enzyme I (PtsI)|nr:phosphoenolpyruvate--protein phosphotransferase [Oscillospiraceae bacterium]
MNVIKGIGASEGIAFGELRAFKKDYFNINSEKIYTKDHEKEIEKYKKSCKLAMKQLDDLYKEAIADIGEEHATIFQVHKMMIEDIDYTNSVMSIIINENSNAEYAVYMTSRNFERTFGELDNDYIQQRASDVRDISKRIISCMSLSRSSNNKNTGKTNIIIGSDDLTPSEFLELDRNFIKGFVTMLGSKNSHTSILARAVNLPCVIGVGGQLRPEYEGYKVIIDSFAGTVYVSPDKITVKRLKKKKELCDRRQELLSRLKGKEDITTDGQKIEICANVSHISDLKAVRECDARGIGLFRSEFIFMNRSDYPTEDEQFQIYKKVTTKMEAKRVVIRTLDVGADKKIKYFSLPEEVNPAMGYRGIRVCLDRPEIFKTQLRAILRASMFGNIEILFPMICSLDEVLKIKHILQEVKQDLDKSEIEYDKNIKIGVMIETPAAVFISDVLAAEVDFFSIGTNDLVQYSLAVDRQNDKVNFMFNPHHKAILRMIKLVCENAKKFNIRIAVCGEIAADESMTEIFLVLGVNELSVSSPFILGIRKKVRETNVSSVREEILKNLSF